MAKKCGFTGKKCMKHDCMFYEQYRGVNRVTGKDEDTWACSQVMIPVMLLENSKQLRSVSASLESMRNVTVEKLDEAMNNMPQEVVQTPRQALK